MTATVLVDPGPERSRGPRSRALRTCPNPPAQTDQRTGRAPRDPETTPPDPGPRAAPDSPPGRRATPAHLLAALLGPLAAWARALADRARRDDRGMSTVEYAIGTLAAAAFAAVLYTVVSGESVVTALTGLVERALQVTF
ncbi:DUF4244 domain-containing protein [Pseudonocardia oroxyli]|uniref:DUF4244 domain-containing protein n=1 Tax=Pseudonocardia oroxyli TaxID=366584 RepID=A0A1G7UQG5_PSEOR|nr:DUF4244 domain-containing protein [Pseudonocardia oroxyli]SDG49588.1 Protein of unknown function [Pseudonocardia oroxyli]